MISASFRHLTGIGAMRERQLWQQGVHAWTQLPDGPILAPALDTRLREGAAISRAWLEGRAWHEFALRLPETEHWRLLPQLLDHQLAPPMERAFEVGALGFVDIETAPVGTGTEQAVTVIGVLDARGAHCYLAGTDLDQFPERTRGWQGIVTFNGASFDLPILCRAFPRWEPPAAHIDLRHLCARVGLKGGLKDIERVLGFIRPPEVSGLTGEDASWLWHAQRRGDRRALARLIAYNLADVAHLKPLLERAYNRALKRTGMPAQPIAESARGELLF
ncbi:MAG: ribonuclease H-like domain-containing protein, partial [Deltaproteobacteria bacterium]|nr:ribonuclease H-like domain-containing protein [Deltaproteobacteria bacterium]